MNLRQWAVLLGASAGVIGEVRRALMGLERSKHATLSGSLPAVFLVGTGVVIGAIAARPELRRRVGEWLIGKNQGPSPQPTTASSQATPGAAGRPQPHADGA